MDVVVLPAPEGLYATSTKPLELIDYSCSDTYGSTGCPRKLMVSVFNRLFQLRDARIKQDVRT